MPNDEGGTREARRWGRGRDTFAVYAGNLTIERPYYIQFLKDAGST